MNALPAAADGDPLLAAVARSTAVRHVGRVAEALGTLIRVTGIHASIGELCELRTPGQARRLTAEVVGVSGAHTLLTPLGPLEGISTATEVVAIGHQASVRVGPGLLGRILDPLGHPMDGLAPFDGDDEVPVHRESPNPLQRTLIAKPFASGVRAIDAALTVGEGQRVGIFAVAGGGKSTLLGMLARGADADVNVIVLVGERGREVNEFIHDNLGEAGLARSVLVVATSDRPASERARAAHLGTAIAEYFRDQGKRVLLMMDSATRYARALRDIGLAVGEPPARRGYPPSVFSELPRLFERAGNNELGSITAFYTVLMEEEDGSDPVAEEVRSILDGHIILSRKLAAAHHYPAIDVLTSASRVMTRVVDADHARGAGQLRKYLAKHREIELLLQLGEYKHGSDPDADFAIARIEEMRGLLRQPAEMLSSFDEALQGLRRLFP
ncbi:MAG TPA: FliI/YscN family ATPase [Dokdonella sp.]|uniref:FliI/YscN family ATPase n=1 Tax=Dokdonella sp. TaxID=2291710 RepID=UPI0025BA3D5F|nr:FliI/YscN family ATPase [Dokdonella sp.]MBX3691613.1 FliI/YscN family ATPase [Dokdonella sp.]MCW5567892.1 FliI/YscN family ATPase [Dokdonella sp.]HNR90877.1 FliI/YscN family ATPase [Dokdonella sp.]